MIPSNRGAATGVYLSLLACAGIGAIITTQTPSEEAVQRQEMHCDPVEQRPDSDQEAWQMLIDQGYTTDNGHTFVPPGCEGVK